MTKNPQEKLKTAFTELSELNKERLGLLTGLFEAIGENRTVRKDLTADKIVEILPEVWDVTKNLPPRIDMIDKIILNLIAGLPQKSHEGKRLSLLLAEYRRLFRKMRSLWKKEGKRIAYLVSWMNHIKKKGFSFFYRWNIKRLYSNVISEMSLLQEFSSLQDKGIVRLKEIKRSRREVATAVSLTIATACLLIIGEADIARRVFKNYARLRELAEFIPR